MIKKRLVRRAVVIQPTDTSIRYIPLTQGQISIVDATDYEHLDQWNWCAHWNPYIDGFYAVRRLKSKDGKVKLIGMHSVLVKCSLGNLPDHVNGDTLDNRRSNLQELPHGLNLSKGRMAKEAASNTGLTGVHFDISRGKYIASFGRKHLGRFDTIELATARREKEVDREFIMFRR